MSVVDKIQHYQRSLERCTENETRTLHCIEKLYRLPVTVQHLQETGVGRTVNALRKYDGSIGDAAKALVAKWKTMVVDEETSEGEDEDEACVPDAPEGYSDRSNSPKPDRNNRDDSSRNSSKHKSNESREKTRSSEKNESRHGNKNSSSTSENSRPRENETKSSRETNEERHRSKNGLDKRPTKSEEKNEKRSKSSRELKNEGKNGSTHGSSSNKINRSKSEDSRKDSSRVSSSSGNSNHSGTMKNSSKNRDLQKKRKLDSLNERESSKRRKSLESQADDECEDDEEEQNHDEDDDDDDDDLPTQILPRDSNDENKKILPDTLIGSDSDSDIPAKIKVKLETPDSPPFYERGSPNFRQNTKIDKSSRSKSREKKLESEKRRDNDKRERAKSERETSEHRKNEKRKDEARSPSRESSTKARSLSGSSSSSKDRANKDKEENRELLKIKKENRSDSDSKESKEKFKEPKDKKVKKKKINGDGGIDCNSGASFAEALGMCTDRPSGRKKNPVSPSSPLIKTIKTEPGTSTSALPSSSSSASSSSSSGSKNSVKIKTEPASEPQPLSLLAPNVKLEPLNVDLASTLPEISPNYKPLPAHYSNPLHRRQDEDKALSDVIYAKGQRTKVYSGMKSGYTSVPSLCEVCIRVLIKHMDALGFTGGIPYDILKPVLERAMPDQLFTLENYNPYLIEDTDSLWQFHCNREFREKHREEMESWRDMYMRCRDEREVKLKALTANIKESIDKSLPVRSAKLAYVDNVVKPPRNVLRKQAKYGTAKSSTPSSDLKKKMILSGVNTLATNISVPPPPMSRMKSSSSGVIKKNKAPLMAKALQLIKGRYKR